MNKQDLLQQAKNAVSDRGEQYGTTQRNFQDIANYWSLHLSSVHGQHVILKSEDVASMMILMKIARLDHDDTHEDSMVDIAGYAACWADLHDEDVNQEGPVTSKQDGSVNWHREEEEGQVST